MPDYCVNKNAQSGSGDHEVHDVSASCPYVPSLVNQLALGWHATCTSAVAEATKTYPDSNGCFYCARACHTT